MYFHTFYILVDTESQRSKFEHDFTTIKNFLNVSFITGHWFVK
jgi:hypothetical protein